MSPAAVDMQSPFTSSTQMQSTQQEGLFTPQSSDPNSCFSFDFGSFPGKFSVPALPGRSKPRLAKTRRHLPGKVKSVPAENKSGFNPSHVATSSTSNGYFFCTNENSLNANSYLEKNQSNGASCNSNSECKESKNNEFGKFLSGGFVFGCENSCSVQSSNLENGEYGEMRESNVFLNSDEVRFEFVATRGDSNSISNLATEESSENIEKLVHDTRGELKVNSEEADNVGLVFGGKWCEPRSNLNRVKSQLNEDWGKSVPIGTQKKKSGAQLGKFDSMGFVFRATPKGSSSTSSFQNEFDHGGEKKVDIELELRKAKTNDIFVFGGSSKKNSSSSDINKLSDEVNKQNTENSRIKINFVDNDIHRSDSVVNNKYNFVFESSFNATCASGLSTAEELSDEMGKLRVDDSKNMCNSADKKTPLHDSCASSDHVFIFGSSKMSSGSCSGQSGITKIKDVNLQGPWSGRSGVGVSDEQIKLGCLFETCEEKWPCNVNERSSDDPSVGISTPKSFTFQAGPSKTSGRRQDQVSIDSILKKCFDQSLFSSGICDLEVPFLGRVESKDNLSFTSKPAEVGACAADLRTPNWDASSSFAANLVTGFSKNAEYSERNRSIRNKRWKKRGGKLRQVDQVQQKPSKNNEGSQQNLESPGCYSPMDFSPYQDDHCAPSINATSSGFAKDEAVATAKGADTSRGEENCRQPNEEFSKNFYERFGAETECRSFKPEQICTSNDDGADGTADAAISNSKGEENECRSQFCFASRTEDNLRNFNFCATSAEDNVSAAKCRNRKKYRLRVGHGTNSVTPMHKVDTASSSVQFPLPDSNYLHVNQAQDKERDIVNSQMKVENNLERDGKHSKQSTAAIKKVCQKWRIRGNLAYEKGSLSKAEEFYTKGINSFPHTGSPGCCIEPLVLCYSNRAATRMSCGRMREALGDCVMAATLDPDFRKVQIRAANCHLALGEVEEARQYFSKCLDTNGDVCLDRRIAIEAASGLQNAQRVAECMHHCAELLRQRTSTAANSALEIISAVLPTSSYSENLLELKGEALLMLRRYKEVIQLCEQTLVFAEKNFSMVASDNNLVNVDGPKSKNSTIRLWRLRLMSKSYFHLGRLELALDLLEKQEFLRSAEDRSNSEDLSMPFVATVRELLLHKNAGNEAFQSGRHMEAVEHYSAAMSSSIESRPFAAICFCNRAAAHQALGQLSDAISDCSTAIALDGSYSKAVSRRATLHERIRDFENATSDLQILISLLDEQFQGSASSSDRPSGSNVEELRQARCRLSSVEGKANRGLPLDHYLILGVKSSDTGSEIKKAYRRAALRHHPDKAGQFLARSESGDDGELWKEISEKVQKDADRLFKMIGEAYAVLSDPTKRSQYDLEEEFRNVQESNTNRASKGPSDFYSTPFKSRRNGRYGQESWRTYGNSRSQW